MTTAAPPREDLRTKYRALGEQATEYVHLVVSGKILAGQPVVKACARHLQDLEHAHERGLRYDVEAAGKAIFFFSNLKHYKGEWAGQPLSLELWQKFIVGCLFGWLRADGTRRFRVAYIEIPRKNGKSLLAAGIGLLLAFFDGEGGAEVYSAATKRDQAKIVWGDARTMVLASQHLKQRIGITGGQTGVGNLYRQDTNSKFQPLGADADSMDGLNIHGAVIDELHAHKTRNMWDVLQTATGARRQPLMFAITTAGYDRHSVCFENHDYGLKVLDGVFDDDTFFVYIASCDEGDDWADPATWQKANPNFGVSVKPDDLERKAEKARQVPAEQNAFLRLHLNVWTEQATRWLDMETWDASAGPLTHDEMLEELKGRECFAGGDLSSTQDLTSIELIFPDDDGGVDVLTFPFIPEDNMRRRSERDRVPYQVWADQGYIEMTEGNVIDHEHIRRRLNELAEDYVIKEIGYDPFSATQFAIHLQGDGFTVVPIRQGFLTLSEPTKAVERLMLAGKLRHGGHPVLRWAVSNVQVRTDPAGNIKPDKERSTERIDPLAALVTGMARFVAHEGEDDGPSMYESESLEWL